jgi:hypothetical protein
MNFPNETFAARRERLAAEIERQRVELVHAYRNLEKPVHYAEYGLRGFGFLRKNAWVFTAVPAVLSIGSTLLGLKKIASLKGSPRQRQSMEPRVRVKGLRGTALKFAGHGWRLFKIYRRVRPFFV